ncbi:MAG: hypothetical protein NW223_22475 [Hyphomicrobiaceae bacterium]|nr:hypothetical protein [Hyphomicrobiaceae bacterium]
MSAGPDDRRELESLVEDIELELAAIRLVTDRERLERPRPRKAVRLAEPGIPARVIDSRGIDINKTSRDNLPKPRPAERPHVSLAERLAHSRAEAAE